ncbi:MAG: glucose-6-phosphate dehydrogenase assembly protein OpcA [Parachlamydiaceae bacterium]|nr:glucose-6-phosphate dehydrogenase assembly protein OpcA [Parachlamydiaceae bacterium]
MASPIQKNSGSDATSIKNQLQLLDKLDSSNKFMKACLFNLIIYMNDAQRTDYFKEITAHLIKQFPCRIFFIEKVENPTKDELELKITTDVNENNRGLNCDHIYIRASEKNLYRVPTLILPLFVPDLEIYTIWGEDPTLENPILPYFEKLAKKLVFDAKGVEDLQEFTRNILKRIESSSSEIVDMTWARINGWREVLSQTYDSPERLEQLETAHSIKITYHQPHDCQALHSSTKAIYLQGWIASSLGWKFESKQQKEGHLILKYSSSKGNHSIELIPGNNPFFLAEEILEIEVTGPNDYQCTFKRQNKQKVEVHAFNQYQCELPFILLMPTLETGKNLIQQMIYLKVSHHYHSLIRLLSSINWSK